ncbi:TIGR03758 family integrating conjugative element protein (plasmid) [Pantoea piersonii]|uniref:TIGR03758 family integrating conjugative element protein n=1 Tax=Pantoea piersonii TaxID=2364647 RepID=A0AAJ5QQ28_9GAMM|nr:TIGR03758 family integrating conjugative element protein [Pantoea piersonii]POW52733.1 TIGR03758 family integrating conjugative element protein [Pantoea alvi]WBG93613.1 TIGR03758 family integrating conjugative element protein [Pantoea piersonii]
MAMTAAQEAAFKAGSGNVEPNLLHLLCLGLLIGFLFFWAAWAIVDVYSGWTNQRLKEGAMGRAVVRSVLLLVVSIWMFCS